MNTEVKQGLLVVALTLRFCLNSQKKDIYGSESRMNIKQNQQISVRNMRDIINLIQLMLINIYIFFHSEHLSSKFFFQTRRFSFLEKTLQVSYIKIEALVPLQIATTEYRSGLC